MEVREVLPNFIIGGAPRAGTTWLYQLLDRHPQVAMAQPARPEPKFFLVDEEYGKGLAHYSQRWFCSLPTGCTLGEKSANYLESSQAAVRIAKDLPDVRLVFSVREPASRALSNFLWSRNNGLESLDFATALSVEPEREATYATEFKYSRPYSYFSRGLYATHLRNYFDRMARDRILVVRFEDIVNDPARVAIEVHTFLGLEGRQRDALATGIVNPSVGDDEDYSAELEQLRERYRLPDRELAALLGPTFEIWDEA